MYFAFVEIGNMFRKFYPEANEHLVSNFVKEAEALNKAISPAAVQGHFMFFKTQPEAAIENISRIA
jgi:chaperone BCS1